MDVFRRLRDLAKYPNYKLVRTAKYYIKQKNATSLATTKRMRKGDSFPVARDNMTRHEVFESYFDLFKETLERHNLMGKPAQIYSCDESGMPLEHKLPKPIAVKGTKKVRQITSGIKQR